MERKCGTCGEWNTDRDYCNQCGEALSLKVLRQIHEERRILEEEQKPKEKVELLLENFKSSRFIIVRILYYVLFSIWALYMGLLTLILWIIAAIPG